MKRQSAIRATFYGPAPEHHCAGIGELITPGAGLDMRAYRLPPEAMAADFLLSPAATGVL